MPLSRVWGPQTPLLHGLLRHLRGWQLLQLPAGCEVGATGLDRTSSEEPARKYTVVSKVRWHWHPNMSFRWGPYKPPFGVSAIYSQSSVCIYIYMYCVLRLNQRYLYTYIYVCVCYRKCKWITCVACCIPIWSIQPTQPQHHVHVHSHQTWSR